MRSQGPSAPVEGAPETPAGRRGSGGGVTPITSAPRSFVSGLASFGEGWGTGRWFLLAFAAIVAGMLFMGRQWFFGTPIYELGDNAANSLQIYRATHLLEYLGNYSRFGFHHPGPAFFYVYAAGEILFYNALHVVPAPENAHLLAGALLQSAFLATAIAVVSRYAAPRRGLFVTAAIAVAFVHFQLSGNPNFSVWPPEQPVVPFACFVAVAVAVACGRLALLTVLVICGGFLVHGHVAQPLYVVPMSALALGLGARRDLRERALTVRGFVRANLNSLVIAAAILAVFLAPLLRDAAQPNSNLGKILASLTQPRVAADVHTPPQIVEYVLSFFGYPVDVYRFDSNVHLGSFLSAHWAGFAVSLAALFLLPLALLVTDRRRRASVAGQTAPEESAGTTAPATPVSMSLSRFYLTYYGFVVLAAALTFVWVAIQKGGLYAFNTYFAYGLMFAAALPTLVAICRRWPVRRLRLGTGLAGILAIVVVGSAAVPMPLGDFPEGRELHDSLTAVMAARTSHDPVLLEFATDDDWNQAAGISLVLLRTNVPWYVEPRWGFNFGEDHVYYPGSPGPSPEIWTLTAPNAANVGQIVLNSRIAIYPVPASLSSYSRAP
jgi:hypothetical protein